MKHFVIYVNLFSKCDTRKKSRIIEGGYIGFRKQQKIFGRLVYKQIITVPTFGKSRENETGLEF